MTFTETALRGVYVIDPEPIADARGFFARTWCVEQFGRRGLNTRLAQCSVSFNLKRGTLRGLHFQTEPYQEAKVVRCTSGSIYDVAVDLRAGSPTYARHVALVLSAGNRRMLYVPEGVAHGFQTLEDDTEVFYEISEMYHPEHAAGVAWDDPAFGIEWPVAAPIMSERDRSFPHLLPPAR
jgi:dTDP-4-dehydrorhamnose 3,5-epimerase